MWILPTTMINKSITYPSVVELREQESLLKEYTEDCAQSLSWRGKCQSSATWLRRWKRNGFLQLLSTQTVLPSHTESFEDLWTSVLSAHHVNHSALPGVDEELMMSEQFSLKSLKDSSNASQKLLWQKMSKVSSPLKLQKGVVSYSCGLLNWKELVTAVRGACTQRQKSAAATYEKEFLLSEYGKSWSTPRAGAIDNTRPNGKGGIPLSQQVKETPTTYPTPRTSDAEGGRIETMVEDGAFKSKRHKSNQTFGAKLRDAVETFPTPLARDYKVTPGDKAGRDMTLPKKVYQMFPTPTAAEGTKIGSQPNYGQKGLSNHPSIVGETTRPKMSKSFPTPTTRDWKGAYPKESQKKKPRNLLPDSVGETTRQDLIKNSSDGKSLVSLKLNARWVEQMMGFPVGWTHYECWETQ